MGRTTLDQVLAGKRSWLHSTTPNRRTPAAFPEHRTTSSHSLLIFAAVSNDVTIFCMSIIPNACSAKSSLQRLKSCISKHRRMCLPHCHWFENPKIYMHIVCTKPIVCRKIKTVLRTNEHAFPVINIDFLCDRALQPPAASRGSNQPRHREGTGTRSTGQRNPHLCTKSRTR